ncbi:hypothetical protein [Nostoc sp. CALU 1950]
MISFSALFLSSENSQPSIICLLGVKTAKQSRSRVMRKEAIA